MPLPESLRLKKDPQYYLGVLIMQRSFANQNEIKTNFKVEFNYEIEA